MPGDAEATRKRLLEAASEEFAAYGIAGARVDRIAARAASNKAQIYHYFGSKDALFDAVFDAMVEYTVRDVPIDPDDLPGYAGRLFDRHEEHPRIARIATWYRLERADSQSPIRAAVASNEHKVAAIAEAQRSGRLPGRWTPEDLLALVLSISGMWTALTPEAAMLYEGRSREQRRAVVTGAVAALLAG
ncbi:MAG TPA: TetR family transcriptional regulator [Pseudonocardia sp.]|jgi:AcrR family transcriptional regulator